MTIALSLLTLCLLLVWRYGARTENSHRSAVMLHHKQDYYCASCQRFNPDPVCNYCDL